MRDKYKKLSFFGTGRIFVKRVQIYFNIFNLVTLLGVLLKDIMVPNWNFFMRISAQFSDRENKFPRGF
jgi:hypothetical protein